MSKFKLRARLSFVIDLGEVEVESVDDPRQALREVIAGAPTVKSPNLKKRVDKLALIIGLGEHDEVDVTNVMLDSLDGKKLVGSF